MNDVLEAFWICLILHKQFANLQIWDHLVDILFIFQDQQKAEDFLSQ